MNDQVRRYYRFARANTNAERMMREVVGTLEELGLLGHTVSIGAIHGAPRVDAAGTCTLVVSVRAYPDWLLAAAPVLDRRGLVARARDEGTEVRVPAGVMEAGVNISSLD
ncbi:MAG: hypothetical protein DI597_02200 [Pseudoxanthomonas spadix]|nr:MAG: hypothetical protein DI597_02200 [Pseudoxanthomonas spadix]